MAEAKDEAVSLVEATEENDVEEKPKKKSSEESKDEVRSEDIPF
ncbi:hypothetical protein ES703_85730 [subsurface metagenome]